MQWPYNRGVTTETPSQGLLEELRNEGLKITGPRSLVIEYVAKREDNFTAEELAVELAAIGRATVYRTVKLLLEHGLICRVILSDGSVCYRVSHKAHHHHLVCVSCGATEDVHLSDVEAVLSGVREATDYELLGHRIEVYGICPACKARAARSTRPGSSTTITSRCARETLPQPAHSRCTAESNSAALHRRPLGRLRLQ